VRGPQGERGQLSPAWNLTSTGRFASVLSPWLVRTGARLPLGALRLDLHPADLDQPRLMDALERVLARVAGERVAVTYGELAGR